MFTAHESGEARLHSKIGAKALSCRFPVSISINQNSAEAQPREKGKQVTGQIHINPIYKHFFPSPEVAQIEGSG